MYDKLHIGIAWNATMIRNHSRVIDTLVSPASLNSSFFFYVFYQNVQLPKSNWDFDEEIRSQCSVFFFLSSSRDFGGESTSKNSFFFKQRIPLKFSIFLVNKWEWIFFIVSMTIPRLFRFSGVHVGQSHEKKRSFRSGVTRGRRGTKKSQGTRFGPELLDVFRDETFGTLWNRTRKRSTVNIPDVCYERGSWTKPRRIRVNETHFRLKQPQSQFQAKKTPRKWRNFRKGLSPLLALTEFLFLFFFWVLVGCTRCE